jgi:hypothetical protein
MVPIPDELPLDHSVYPDLATPPVTLATDHDKADYLHRVCAAFDFGVYPEQADWDRFATWKPIFDAFPLPDSPAYHTFRFRFGWEAVPRGTCGLTPQWKIQDLREGRNDPCEEIT